MVQNPPSLFRDLFVRSAGIPEERFEVHLFLRCVPPLRRPLARILLRIKRSIFERDFTTLRAVAAATSVDEVRRAARDLRGGPLYRSHWVRDRVGVRASGRRLVVIASEVLG